MFHESLSSAIATCKICTLMIDDSSMINTVGYKTRLPSNLRPTTREWMHLVTRCHFRSRDRDGRTIRSATTENAVLHVIFTVLCVIETALLPLKSIHSRNKEISTYFCCRDVELWHDDLHVRTWPALPGDIPLRQVQKWTSYAKAFGNYRLTDIHTDRQTDR